MSFLADTQGHVLDICCDYKLQNLYVITCLKKRDWRVFIWSVRFALDFAFWNRMMVLGGGWLHDIALGLGVYSTLI